MTQNSERPLKIGRAIGYSVSQHSIITSKLTPPRSPASLISIGATTQLLSEINSKSFILVTAPAGYGKTTLLAQLRKEQSSQGKTVAWLTLDDSDIHLSQFITYLVESLKYIGCPIGDAALTVFHKASSKTPEAFRNLFINEIHSFRTPLIIIIDDLHYVKNTQILNLIDQLINYAPSNLCIVVASRHVPPLSIARYRVHGSMIEIKSEDLQLSYEETDHFISQTLGLQQSDVSLSRRLHEVTGGWVAALQLATISMKNSDDVERILGSFSGCTVELTEFLYTDVLSRLSEQITHFLLKTSILRRINFELCAAVTELPNCSHLMDRVKQLNLFLTPVEGMETWHVYHPLFREFLQMNLMKLPNVDIEELHCKASEWYEGQNLFADALQHALDGNDGDRALRLLERSAVRILGEGRFHTVVEWHENLKPTSIEDYPNIWLATAYCLMLCFRIPEARAMMRKIRKTRLAKDELTKFRLSVIELTIAMYEDNGEKILKLYDKWPEVLPFKDPLFVPASLNPISMAFSQKGEFEKARDIYNYSVGIPEEEKGFMATTYHQCYLAHSYAMEGRLKMAERYCRERLILSEKRSGYFSEAACASAGFLSEILYETNRLDEIFVVLSERMNIIGENLTPDGIIKPYISLTKAHLCCEEFEDALSVVSELYSIGQKNKQKRFMIKALAARIRIYLQTEDPTSAEVALKQLQRKMSGVNIQSALANEMHTISSLAQVRIWIYQQKYEPALKELLFIRDNKVYPRQRWLISQIEALIFSCNMSITQDFPAESQLHKILSEGMKMGLIRTFLDEKHFMECMQELRDKFVSNKDYRHSRDYFLLLLDQWKKRGRINEESQALEESDIVYFTDRERQILTHVAHGLPNKSIATKLSVSVDTIKYHLKKIYTKIGVSSRIDAGIYAQKMGLIDT